MSHTCAVLAMFWDKVKYQPNQGNSTWMLHGVYVVFVGYAYLDDLICTYITSLGILVLKKSVRLAYS